MANSVRENAVSRRAFIEAAGRVTAGGIGCAFLIERSFAGAEPAAVLPPVAVFSKLYQELKLDFEQSAEVTAEAGLDGIDCAVRDKGEIEPERAADEMPRYAEALGKHGVKMLLLTTGILGVDSAHCRDILSTAKNLGIRYYRLGFWPRPPDVAADKHVAEIQARLKELAALNRELGVCALFENHSASGTKIGPKSGGSKSSGMAGGDLSELYEIVKDFDPNQIAVAFDLGHAMIMHGDQWHQHFERLNGHIRIAYIKDVGRTARFVPFGEGEFAKTDFFTLLKKMNYRTPISMHIEYAWAPDGKKTRPTMVEMLKNSRRVLGGWWEQA
jgi:sugar phosphate isomerase/epimerase